MAIWKKKLASERWLAASWTVVFSGYWDFVFWQSYRIPVAYVAITRHRYKMADQGRFRGRGWSSELTEFVEGYRCHMPDIWLFPVGVSSAVIHEELRLLLSLTNQVLGYFRYYIHLYIVPIEKSSRGNFQANREWWNRAAQFRNIFHLVWNYRSTFTPRPV